MLLLNIYVTLESAVNRENDLSNQKFPYLGPPSLVRATNTLRLQFFVLFFNILLPGVNIILYKQSLCMSPIFEVLSFKISDQKVVLIKKIEYF